MSSGRRLYHFPFIPAVILAITLSGCSGPSGPSLTVAMSLSEQEWTVMRRDIFPAFEKDRNIKVNGYQIEADQLTGSLEALQKGGRSKIDLFAQDNMDLAQMVTKGLVEDLSSCASQLPSQILPALIENCKFGDRMMFMPFRPNVQIVYYNSREFDRLGLAVPRTWDELLDTAKKLKAAQGQGKVLLQAFGGNPTATQIHEFVLQAGGDPYAFDDEGTIKAFTFLAQLWPYCSEDSRRAKWDTANESLATGQSFIGQNWTFGINVLVKDYQLPYIKTYSGWKGPAGERHVIGGDVLGIPKDSPHKSLALEFIAYLQSKPVQETLVAKLGWPSIRTDAYAAVEDWQKPYYESVQAALRQGEFRKNVAWWPAYSRYITDAFREIVMEGAPVEPTLKKYKALLEEEKKRY
ncbi:MAG: ABC transporter substrate-binding protein [Deltaproteobacteria bacterium]